MCGGLVDMTSKELDLQACSSEYDKKMRQREICTLTFKLNTSVAEFFRQKIAALLQVINSVINSCIKFSKQCEYVRLKFNY